MKEFYKGCGKYAPFRYLKKETRDGQQNNPRRRPLTLLLVLSLLIAVTMPAFAFTPNTKKEEVVYVNLNNDGTVKGIYVVNSFELNGQGQIIDYGDYTGFRNMTAMDEIKVEGERITIDTKARKLYYEGTLNSNAIPWVFDIKYFMDGVEYTAAEIAGKTGSLEIRISVRQNRGSHTTFFDHYTLQVSVELDTALCKNITAPGATLANAGKYKQAAFTILPGKEKDISITADVTDFRMPGISINGIYMQLDVDLDDTSDFEEELAELKDGVAKLDDGANELKDGARKLHDGTRELEDGISELNDGVTDLKDNTGEFVEGSSDLVDGVTKLHKGVGRLKDGTSDFKDGVLEFARGINGINSGVYGVVYGVTELDTGMSKLREGTQALSQGAKDLHNGASELSTGVNSLYKGLEELTSQNDSLISMSNGLYLQTLAAAVYDSDFAALGIDKDTPAERLNQLLAAQIQELAAEYAETLITPELFQSTYLSTVNERMAELAALESPTDEDLAELQYWQFTLVVMGEEGYQASLKLGEAPTEEQVYAHEKYEELCDPYGGEEPFRATYSDLEASMYGAKQTVIARAQQTVQEYAGREAYDYVVASGRYQDDPVCKYLMVLSYYKGVIEYANGARQLGAGAKGIAWGADSLSSGAYQLRHGIDGLHGGVTELKDGTSELLAGVKKLWDGTGKLVSGVISLRDGSMELHEGVVELEDGTSSLLDGVIELSDGTIKLHDGIVELSDGTMRLLDGAIELSDGTLELYDGTVTLSDGTFEFRDKTATIDTDIIDIIKEKIDEIMGGNLTPVSFVSEKNTNVTSVQFVMKTPDIEELEIVTVKPEKTEKLTFWQRFLALFGWKNDSR